MTMQIPSWIEVPERDRQFPLGARVSFRPVSMKVEFVDASPIRRTDPFIILRFFTQQEEWLRNTCSRGLRMTGRGGRGRRSPRYSARRGRTPCIPRACH